jgi:negative regulator of sigma-B (phosphoserine phosphatase)
VAEVAGQPTIEWGVACSTREHERFSGDQHFVHEDLDRTLFAVIDGLGHGAPAALAAARAVDTLNAHVQGSIPAMIAACHESQRGLRGVVMSLVKVDARRQELTWLGVGNVFGVLLRAQSRDIAEHLLVRPGIVGSNLPSLQEITLPFRPGDALVVATDGVELGILPQVPRRLSSQEAAERLLKTLKSRDDDQLVLVVNIRSATP